MPDHVRDIIARLQASGHAIQFCRRGYIRITSENPFRTFDLLCRELWRRGEQQQAA